MTEPRTPCALIDEESADLDDRDHRRLARVEYSLTRALALRDWWAARYPAWKTEFNGDRLAEVVEAKKFENCFPVGRTYPAGRDTEANFGFFDQAPIDGRDRPVMGLALQTLFDEPRDYFARADRAKLLDHWRRDLRAFTLDYLIRLTGFHDTTPWVDPNRRPIEPWARPFSMCPEDEDRRSGFGFSQLYYKRKGGSVGKFRDVDRTRIDLHTLGHKFEWIVVGIRIHDLYLRHPAIAWANLAIRDEALAILHPHFLVDVNQPNHKGVHGRYGFGYAVLEDPPEEGPPLVFNRPAFGFQQHEFVMLDRGRVLARIEMVTEKLNRLLAVNPMGWAKTIAERGSLGLWSPAADVTRRVFDMAMPGALRPFTDFVGATTAGGGLDPITPWLSLFGNLPMNVAADLCISRDAIIQSLLADLLRSELSTILGSRGMWRAVPDWADARSIPAWVPRA